MTAMPQLVALFNGVGGGAAALVALLELAEAPSEVSNVDLAAMAFTRARGGGLVLGGRSSPSSSCKSS